MKKHLLALSLLSALVSSSALAAGPVANIQVTGNIKPPTCTVNGLEQNDVIFDYGVISPNMIPKSSVYAYPSNSVVQEITIICDAKTYLTFKPTDTYDSVDMSNIVYPQTNYKQIYFKMVSSSDITKAIGGAIFRVFQSSVDGNQTLISRGNDGVFTGNIGNYPGLLVKQATMTWTDNNQNNSAPEDLTLIPGQIFSMTIINNISTQTTTGTTFITSQDALTASGISIADGLDFMGEAVLTFNFGV